ncbi:MAG: glycosyltransferase family 2 protein [Steroidobacteraceae bacterium]|jgi:glycosyltransferase involved in cell wall biosynthesis
MTATPKITVVVPVYNRQAELRRALASLMAQTLADFECLVVDDCSSVPIEPIVAELADARFRYLRNAQNGGPYNARTLGYRHMRGEYLLQLDSDWEAYPWALYQAASYLDDYPDVDAVSGMHVRQRDLAMFVRVGGQKKIIGPREYLENDLVPDCIGAVRRVVVKEWLAKRADYFAMEFHQWFTFGLHHRQLYVDEPWTRYHVDGGDRVSTGHHQRRLDDYVKFIDEHDGLLRSVDAPWLSDLLFRMWLDLLRAGRRSDRKRIEEYLRLKNVAVARKLAAKIARKIAGRVSFLSRDGSGKGREMFSI